jgi:ankyrin repeat protein
MVVLEILAAGADAEAKNRWGLTATDHAIRNCRKKNAHLLDADADTAACPQKYGPVKYEIPNRDICRHSLRTKQFYTTRLHKAIVGETKFRIGNELRHVDIDTTDAFGNTALHLAAANGNKIMVRLLLRKGADPDRQNIYGETALHAAITNSEGAAYRYVLKKTMNVDTKNCFGATALHYAAALGHDSAVIKLISAGAHVEAKDSSDHTPLGAAVLFGNRSTAELLLKAGACADSYYLSATTVLHDAVLSRDTSMVSMLVQHSANPNARDGEGRTLLHVAVRSGEAEKMLNHLISLGVDSTIVDNYGKNAMEYTDRDLENQ